MPYVYIVRCSDGTYYTGWSTDPVRRVAAHNAGRGGRYTRTHRPVALVYQEEVPDRKSAMRREVAIKAYTRDRKERLIAERSSPAYGSIHETDITAPAEGTGARDDSQP